MKKKVCPVCKKEFVVDHPGIRPGKAIEIRRIYCGAVCRRRRNYIENEKGPPVPRESTCVVCGKTFVENDRRIRTYCSKKCGASGRSKRYYKKHESRKSKDRQRAFKRRMTVIKTLGGKCAKCGIDDWRILQINHLNGGGNRDVKSRRSRNHGIQMEILKGKRKDLNLLCANCNILYEYERGIRWKGIV